MNATIPSQMIWKWALMPSHTATQSPRIAAVTV